MTNTTKIIENAKFLGLSHVKIDSTEKRSAVRKLLNGLGFATADYIEIPMPTLQVIYNEGLLMGRPMQLGFIRGCDSARAELAIRHFREATAGKVDSAPMPISAVIPEMPKAESPAITTPPVKKEQPKMNESEAISALRALLGAQPATVDESRVLELVKLEVAKIQKPMPTQIEIVGTGEVKDVGLHHALLPTLVKALSTGANIMLVGPAGSGKTTLAHQAAETLGVEFYFNGAISSEYKLTGFVDAQGRIVSTAFRKAYENGGVYLFDEIDASMPDALLAFNAALANGHMDFPDGTIKRHAKFYCIAAANTFGKGADRIYVGRNQLDAASLDRFIVFNVDYDMALERALAGNDNWTDKVQAIRKAVSMHKIRHVVSPRASINGAKMLAAGFKEGEVMDAVIWKGLDGDSVAKIKASC